MTGKIDKVAHPSDPIREKYASYDTPPFGAKHRAAPALRAETI